MISKQEVIDRCIYNIRILFEKPYVDKIKREKAKGYSKPLSPWIVSGENVSEEVKEKAILYDKYFKDLKTSRNKDNQIPWDVIRKHGELYPDPDISVKTHTEIIRAIDDFSNFYKQRELLKMHKDNHKREQLISKML